MAGCPGDETITLFTSGRLDAQGQSDVAGHVMACTSCRKIVGVLRIAASSVTGSSLFASTFGFLTPGTVVGRYQILDLLGAGGMGVVYGAHDPELDRKVALKLLYPTARSNTDLVDKLRAESKTMARVKHPNIATIHDVGTYNEQLFLVLEYVEGSTLRAWVDELRPWPTVLATFAAAGRGLAAAHAAGIVHCDFKPDNVLLASDGRPVVTDFGLAQPLANAGTQVVGTPAYMAPERFDATTPAQIQSDVFGFCVALYEVLYGVRPFAGTTVAELRDAIARGTIARPEAPEVPERIHRVLVRGLSADLAVRHPTIDAVLAELAHEPQRRTAVWAAAGAVGVALVAGGWFATRERGETCDARGELAGAWDGPTHMRVIAGLAGASDPTRRRVERGLERYAGDWVVAADAACKQPGGEVQRRCLRSARIQLATLTGQLALGGTAIVQASDRAVGSLPAIEDCSGTAPSAPVPADPALRGDVDKLRDELGAAQGLSVAAKFDAAKTALDALADRAKKLGYRPLEAEIQYARASNLRGASGAPEVTLQALRDAAASAEASGHEVLAVHAWLGLAFNAAQVGGDFARGREYASYAKAALERLGGDRRLEAKVSVVRGGIEWRDGKLDAARAEYKHALELSADDPEERVDAVSGLGSVDADAGKLSDALAEQLEVLALRRKIYGDDHPEVARSYTTLGNVTMLMGKSTESLDYYQKADATAIRAFGADHPIVQVTAHNLGGILRDLDRPVDAEAAFRRAIRIATVAFGPDHPNVAKSQQSLGMALYDQKRFPEAVAELEHAVAIKRKAYGEDHVETFGAVGDLGLALRAVGRIEEAIDLGAKAVAGFTKEYGPDHTEVAQALLGEARALAAGHRVRDATAAVDRAEAIYKHSEAGPQALEAVAKVRAEVARADAGPSR